MKSLLSALEQPPVDPSEGGIRYQNIRAAIRALRGGSGENMEALQGELTQDHAWELVSFAEIAAEECVRANDPSLAYDAIYAVGLIPYDLVDRRDIMVAVSVLKVGVNQLGRDLESVLDEYHDSDRSIDSETREWVTPLPPHVPSDFEMNGEGKNFVLRPIPSNWDPNELLRKLGQEPE